VLKRGFDLLVASVALVVLSPLMAAVAVAVRLTSPGPIFFHQPRVGKGGKLFNMHKFRTLRVEGDGGHSGPAVPQVANFEEYVFEPLHGGRRYTPIGHFLRSASLDELPNLVNVLAGEMSIVGPRPEVPNLVEQYPPEYNSRHNVRPGITGLAQVSGRGALTYHDTILYDLQYVEQQSFLLDLSILLSTVPVVLSRQGDR
jgi:lipopolysaccharide/colanic/teichoic acid biosynthesis glycosyltransferase